MANGQKVTIDGKEYDLDMLSEVAKGQLMSIRAVDAELGRLQNQIAIYQTARKAYWGVLLDELEKIGAGGLQAP